MFWFFVRLLCFQLYAILLCGIMAFGTIWTSSIEQIDLAYEREIGALRVTSIGEDPDLRLPIEIRGQRTASAIISFCEHLLPNDQIPGAPRDRITSGIEDGLKTVINNDWWIASKPLLKRFLPLAYIRLEIYYLVTIPLIPLLLIAWFLGQSEGKRKIREGYHKRNFFPHYLRFGFRAIRDGTIACTGLVIFPAVAWWVLPTVLITAVMTYLWRAYSIQIV